MQTLFVAPLQVAIVPKRPLGLRVFSIVAYVSNRCGGEGRARARGSDEAGGGQGLDPSGAAADAVGGLGARAGGRGRAQVDSRGNP